MDKPLRLGMAGLGTVGSAVFSLLRDEKDALAARAGRPLVVTAVSARTKNKDRGVRFDGVKWHDDPVLLADDPDVDAVVELMGGAEGAAYRLIEKSLKQDKPVITANKALLALRGKDLQEILSGTRATISFEAAVAGGIPAIKVLREGLAANNIRAVYGILNGTCNYILSEMTASGRAFDDVLKEAQAKGYAEADPSFDVDGLDAGHKLSILAGISFGALPDFQACKTRGIRDVTPLDMAFADELGYRVKLLGIARQTSRGVEQSVEPCLVPKESSVATVDGALNAVYIEGDCADKVLLTGAGAGGKATASAIVADIIDLARGRALPYLSAGSFKTADLSHRLGSYFLRLSVLDQPGVLADVAAILRDCQVSMEQVLQRSRAPGQNVPVILTTHETEEGNILKAVGLISKLESVFEPPHMMRIETFESV